MTTKAQPNVFVFSGHMVDAPNRSAPRFPATAERPAAKRIAAAMDELGAASGDLAICSGAAGGDILFEEACLALGMSLKVFLPFPEREFLRRSVDFAGVGWRARFHAVRQNAHTSTEVLSAVAPGEDPYAACNEAILRAALEHGRDRVRCIVLWDGKGGDGPGGAGHMAAIATARGIPLRRIDPHELPPEAPDGTA